MKMKKVVLVLLLILMCSICFAGGNRYSHEIGVGYSHYFDEVKIIGNGDIRTITSIPSLALNFSGVYIFTEKFGIAHYMNVLIPFIIKTTTYIDSASNYVITERSNYDYFFGIELFFAPTILLYENEKFALPLSVGLNVNLLNGGIGGYNFSLGTIGFGMNITGEFHFNKRLYALVRFQFSTGGISVADSSITGLVLNPSLGFGWKY
jgi:hypothetical protein